jgi:hypothetical protein
VTARSLAEERAPHVISAAPSAEQIAAIAIRAEFVGELASLGISDIEIRRSLASGRRLAELQSRELRRPFRADYAFEKAVNAARSDAIRCAGSAKALDAERLNAATDKADLSVVRRKPTMALAWVERALLRARLATLQGGIGPPWNIGAAIAASEIAGTLRAAGLRTRRLMPLVAALLLNAGLLETGCWQDADGDVYEQRTKWCRKLASRLSRTRRLRTCSRSPLSCALATRHLRNLIG